MRLSKARRKKTIINITSLIDVLFLLLIFLMVSTTFMEEPGMKLDLPKAQSAEIGEKKEVTLYITAQGEVFLNAEKIDIDSLKPKLTNYLEDLPEKQITLKADAQAVHGLVVEVMDIARQVGVQKLLVATRPPEKK